MPRLPNFLIHLQALFRPSLLRPDLRVPSIADVDFRALRRQGFNAVVVDKDNCLTLPKDDYLHPPLAEAWSRLKRAFPPGRVLVVSNSAGLAPKDPGSIAAEHLSLTLRAPVLLHATPKPHCTSDILAYFNNKLGTPTTLQGRIRHAGDDLLRKEKAVARGDVELDEEAEIVKDWIWDLEHGPLLGRKKAARHEQGVEKRMLKSQAETGPNSGDSSPARGRRAEEDKEGTKDKQAEATEDEPLRILVIGDRLFTDVLLAKRLSLLLPSPPSSQTPQIASVLSIHTSLLPQPRDLRLVRWFENRLLRGRLNPGPVDWGRYTLDPEPVPVKPREGWVWDVRRAWSGEDAVSWDRSTWTPLRLAVGAVRGPVWVVGRIGRGAGSGARWSWRRGRRWWSTRVPSKVEAETIKEEGLPSGATGKEKLA